jgi:Predicted 3'-5' exonuclease related to the exonuclease domain of PolB
MFPSQRTSGPWERDVLALRVIPVMADGAVLHPVWPRDAGWLVKQNARIGAIGVATGIMAGDGVEIRLRLVDTSHFAIPVVDGRSVFGGGDSADQEAVLLHGIANQITRFNTPLIVTVGGRSMDLTFLRYRALAREVPLNGLHGYFNGRLNIFDRFDMSRHIDLADVLSTTGASSPLVLHQLCSVACIPRPTADNDLAAHARLEAVGVFAVFVRTLRVMGTLSPLEYQRAQKTVEDANMDA